MVQPVHPIPSPLYRLVEIHQGRQIRMAKQEIHRRMGNPFAAAWWKFMPGTTIVVKWPTGICPDGADSADPNDHYRPELEAAVGKQGREWDWRTTGGEIDTLTIKVRKKHAAWATMALLKWG